MPSRTSRFPHRQNIRDSIQCPRGPFFLADGVEPTPAHPLPLQPTDAPALSTPPSDGWHALSSPADAPTPCAVVCVAAVWAICSGADNTGQALCTAFPI